MAITRLVGPERVRRRPAVMFGSNGVEGAQYAVRNLLKVFVTEAQLEHCNHLKVKHNGATLEISGDDRGLCLGQDAGDDAVWQNLFCRLDAAPAYPEKVVDTYDTIDDSHYILYGDKTIPDDYFGCLELYAFQCSCKYLVVHVNRNGISSTIRFEKGHNIGGIYNQPTAEKNGTCFRFELDTEVFTETVIPEAFFLENLETFAMLVPGFTCTYENATGQEITYCYPEGAKSYIEDKYPGSVYRTKMWAKGRERYNSAEYKAHLEMAIGYTPNAGEVRCYHNLDVLPYGGPHRKELQKRLCKAFNVCYGNNMKLTFEELEKHLTVILSTRCAPLFTAWVNGSRKAIENRLITDMAQDIIDEAFDRYLHEFKEVYQGLVETVLAERKGK